MSCALRARVPAADAPVAALEGGFWRKLSLSESDDSATLELTEEAIS